VFWGLLACEILNGKGRDVVEHTSLKRMKELIEKKYSEGMCSYHEYTQLNGWLVHWILVYSFTAKDLTNTGLFATILADNQLYGHNYLNVIQMRSQSLQKYLIASFILARGQPNQRYQINRNALEQIALPMAMEDNHNVEKDLDAFSGFVKAIYEDYNIEKALEMVEKMAQ